MTEVANVTFIVSGSGVLNLWLTRDDGTKKTYAVAADHENHRKIVEKIKAKDYKGLEELISVERRLETAKERVVETLAAAKVPGSLVGTAEIRDEQIFVNNVPVHNVVTERLMALANQGYPVDPALRFLENVLMNRSSRSQEELYDFLANRNLPLTEDGCFLAYKRIRHDWKDIYSGTIDNSVGKIVEISWKDVDPDRSQECSYGLHVGALDYVRVYGTGSRDNRVVVVKVNPKDCVSVPRDYSHQKLRVCKYEVLYELETGDQEALGLPVYSANGGKFTSVGDWVDDLEEGDDRDADRYWENGWEDDYEEWSIARLRKEIVDRDLLVEEDVPDFLYEELITMLRTDDEYRRDEDERDLLDEEEEEDDYECDYDDCAHCESEPDDTFLVSYQNPAPVVVPVTEVTSKLPNPQELWRLTKSFDGLTARIHGPMTHKLGSHVVVRSVTSGSVTYYPTLSGELGDGCLSLADFVKYFVFAA